MITAKLLDSHAVHLQSVEYDRAHFDVPDPEVWKAIEVGAMGIAETDHGELVGWRTLRPPGA